MLGKLQVALLLLYLPKSESVGGLLFILSGGVASTIESLDFAVTMPNQEIGCGCGLIWLHLRPCCESPILLSKP